MTAESNVLSLARALARRDITVPAGHQNRGYLLIRQFLELAQRGLLPENPTVILELLRVLARVPSCSRKTYKDLFQSLQYPWRSPLHPLQRVLRRAVAGTD